MDEGARGRGKGKGVVCMSEWEGMRGVKNTVLAVFYRKERSTYHVDIGSASGQKRGHTVHRKTYGREAAVSDGYPHGIGQG